MKKSQADILKDQGNQFFKNGKFEESIEYYSRAINLDQSKDVYFNNRAFAYLKCQNYNNALEDAFQALKINNKNAKVYFRLCQILIETNQYNQAYPYALKLLKLDQTVASRDKAYLVINQCNQELTSKKVNQSFFKPLCKPNGNNIQDNTISQDEQKFQELKEQTKSMWEKQRELQQMEGYIFDIKSWNILLKNFDKLISVHNFSQKNKCKEYRLKVLKKITNNYSASNPDYFSYMNLYLDSFSLPSQQQDYLKALQHRAEEYKKQKLYLLAKQDFLYVYKKEQTMEIKEMIQQLDKLILDEKKNNNKKQQQQQQQYSSHSSTNNMDIEPSSNNTGNMSNEDCECSFIKKYFDTSSDIQQGTRNSGVAKYYWCEKCEIRIEKPKNIVQLIDFFENTLYETRECIQNIQFYENLSWYMIDYLQTYLDRFQIQKIMCIQVEMMFIQGKHSQGTEYISKNQKWIFNQSILKFLQKMGELFQLLQQQQQGNINYEQYLEACFSYWSLYPKDVWAEHIRKIVKKNMMDKGIFNIFKGKRGQYIENQEELFKVIQYEFEEESENMMQLTEKICEDGVLEKVLQKNNHSKNINKELFELLLIVLKRYAKQQYQIKQVIQAYIDCPWFQEFQNIYLDSSSQQYDENLDELYRLMQQTN